MNKETKEYEKDIEKKEELSLDNDQRVKILSPGTLVFKRFIRNRLAIVGAIFIIGMFLFSYIGGWLSVYDEDQVFTKYEQMYKIFAGVSENDNFKYIIEDGKEFSLIAQSQLILAINTEEEYFETGDDKFIQLKFNDEYYIVYNPIQVGVSMSIGKDINISISDKLLGNDFIELAKQVVIQETSYFEFNNKKYYVLKNKKNSVFYEIEELAVITKNIFSYATSDIENTFTFCKNIEDAINNGDSSVTIDGINYNLNETEGQVEIIQNGKLYATVSKYQMEPIYDDVFIDLEFRSFIKDAIINNKESFVYEDEDGEELYYRLFRQNLQWTIEKSESTYLIDKYASPSWEHLFGTDGNGMDLLTRIMYGGRISLRIGFIVVIISTIVGVVLGGFAGYFGGRADNFIMRVVDVFNCIPSIPVFIIIGSIMDQLRMDPQLRLNSLMLILAFFSWPYIARLVRGQTLFLREQEFMIATEATGLNVSKRVFKHLIPNIMPQLIVSSTLALGGVILTESALSFLGVGVKFPFASWGNIINAVSNVYVMSNYLFVWIPAGICILITVLGFNFIGDGLRDAFDPKMKR